MVSWSNGIAYFTSESASPGIHKLDWFREIGFVNCSARGPIGKVPALCHTTELKYLGVPPFRIGVFLMHKGDATETAHQSGDEVVVGQITLQSRTLFALAVEQEHSWCPDRIEAVEPCRMFLDVSFYRKEILADEFGSLLIFIRLGIQPSTGSSRRSRAEIQ
jgi:hypothetical protein